MQREVYWIWLQQSLGFASHKLRTVLDSYSGARAFYEAGPRDWRLCGCFTERELHRLESCNLAAAAAIFQRAQGLGQALLTPEDENYPQNLLQLSNPPAVLFYQGDCTFLNKSLCVAVVGTRSATPYGRKTAFDFSASLARAGVCVVSGGALGVDCAAHQGALQANGKTVAVLGCGLNTDYLKTNASLRRQIARLGVLVSEFPPDTPANAHHFPMRNRLISGLAVGTLVVEAGEKSGSLITANLALEQGRDVFAVPGNINSSVSYGANRLIQTGAKPVTSALDIIEEYISVYPERFAGAAAEAPEHRIHKKNKPTYNEDEFQPELKEAEVLALSADAKALFDALSSSPCHIDGLAERAGLSLRQALQAVTELELAGGIVSYSGKRYGRNHEECFSK